MHKPLAKILKIVKANQIQNDASKVLSRVVPSTEFANIDPVVILDYGRLATLNGFADHPHRGFQAVSYFKSGSMAHEDFLGHKSINQTGDVAWITAGRGIVHAEMNASDIHDASAFQLWVSLPSHLKFTDPKYDHYSSADIPIYKDKGVWAKIISGEAFGLKGPAKTPNHIEYFDINLDENASIAHRINAGWNALMFVYGGKARINDVEVEHGSTVIFERAAEEQRVNLESPSAKAELLWISGLPLNEPMIHKGPYVMNSQEQIDHAYEDFEKMQNGFEHRKGYSSEIKAIIEKQNKKNVK